MHDSCEVYLIQRRNRRSQCHLTVHSSLTVTCHYRWSQTGIVFKAVQGKSGLSAVQLVKICLSMPSRPVLGLLGFEGVLFLELNPTLKGKRLFVCPSVSSLKYDSLVLVHVQGFIDSDALERLCEVKSSTVWEIKKVKLRKNTIKNNNDVWLLSRNCRRGKHTGEKWHWDWHLYPSLTILMLRKERQSLTHLWLTL